MKKIILLLVMILTLIGCGEDKKLMKTVKSMEVGNITMEEYTVNYLNNAVLYDDMSSSEVVNVWDNTTEGYDYVASNIIKSYMDVETSVNYFYDMNRTYIHPNQLRGVVSKSVRNYIKKYNTKLDSLNKVYDKLVDVHSQVTKDEVEWFMISDDANKKTKYIKAMVIRGNNAYSVTITPTIEPNDYVRVSNENFRVFNNDYNYKENADYGATVYANLVEALTYKMASSEDELKKYLDLRMVEWY